MQDLKSNWVTFSIFAIVLVLFAMKVTGKQQIVTKADGSQAIQTKYGFPKKAMKNELNKANTTKTTKTA